jgi:hypothetical protein
MEGGMKVEKKSVFEWLSLSDEVLWTFVKQTACKASGPGGQHVNKTSSAILLSLAPLNLSVKVQKHRSQTENKKAALRALREAISLFAEPPTPDFVLQQTKPYFENGLHIQERNPLLPMVYAVLCACFFENQWDHKHVAEVLGVSTSCLIRFLAKNKKLLECVNQIRQRFEKHPLHG